MKMLFILATLVSLYYSSQAQGTVSSFFEVGKPCPDFAFDDVQYYYKSKVTLDDFKGKWLILDCWNQYCGGCLRSLPTIDSLQRKFQGRIQFLSVAYTGSQYLHVSNNTTIRDLYERNRINKNLSLSIAYDSVLFHRFNIKATPYIVIIDPNGIVRGITIWVTEADLNNLLSGKPVTLPKAYRLDEDRRNISQRTKGIK